MNKTTYRYENIDPKGGITMLNQNSNRESVIGNNTEPKHEVNYNEFLFVQNGKEGVDKLKIFEHIQGNHHTKRVSESQLMTFSGKSYNIISPNDCKFLIKCHIPPYLRKPAVINEIYTQLITEELVPLSLFNSDENIINFNNGILHLDTGEITPHSPNVYSSILIPCDYNAGLTLDDCPKFKKFIYELTDGNEEIIYLIMTVIGVIISNVYGYRYKKLFILLGKGNTGKSVLRSLVMKIIGKDNCHSIDIKQLNSRFGAAQIINKRMAGAGDMSVTRLDDIEIIKQLTGGDDVNADRKGIDAISFQYKGLLWFNTNKLPIFSGDKGKHVYERFIIVPCNNIIADEKRNTHLVEELYEERNAIISVAIEALKQSIQNGYRFTECDTIIKEREKYELVNNSLKLFVDEYCVLNEGTTIRSAFNKFYIEWCSDNGFIPENKSNIGAYLEEHYNIIARKTGGGNMHYDLRIDFGKLGQKGQMFSTLHF